MRPTLRLLVVTSVLLAAGAAGAADTSLRFFGHGTGDIDHVEIPLDAPARPDPTLAGATLVLGRGSAEVASIALPAVNWRGLGSPPGSRGWRYADAQRASGPCTRVVVKQKSLVASCTGDQLAFTLDEPAQGALAVSFASGSGRRTCLAFGGIVSRDVFTAPGPVGLFRARSAPAPASCPPP
jgi:hypothetical protein